MNSFFPPKKILLATDGSENALRAEEVAIQLAKDHEAELLIISVTSIAGYLSAASVPFGVYDTKDVILSVEEGSKKLVSQSEQRAKDRGVRVQGETLESASSVVDEITRYAETKKVDLIVIGTRGLGGFKRLLLGSVSSGVVTHAHCNVLVVK